MHPKKLHDRGHGLPPAHPPLQLQGKPGEEEDAPPNRRPLCRRGCKLLLFTCTAMGAIHASSCLSFGMQTATRSSRPLPSAWEMGGLAFQPCVRVAGGHTSIRHHSCGFGYTRAAGRDLFFGVHSIRTREVAGGGPRMQEMPLSATSTSARWAPCATLTRPTFKSSSFAHSPAPSLPISPLPFLVFFSTLGIPHDHHKPSCSTHCNVREEKSLDTWATGAHSAHSCRILTPAFITSLFRGKWLERDPRVLDGRLRTDDGFLTTELQYSDTRDYIADLKGTFRSVGSVPACRCVRHCRGFPAFRLPPVHHCSIFRM